jgi:hypothetical protein
MQVERKARLEQALLHVDGWLRLDEAWALHETVRDFDSGNRPITVVEIGSWKGRSTIALALAVETRGAGTVFAIDPHTGAPEGRTAGWTGAHIQGGPVITAEEFRRNIASAGVQSFVELLIDTSHNVRPRFAANSIDVLFIDGSHVYEDVKMDIMDWHTALNDNAIVAFNDPSAPGVYRALLEFVVRPGTPYRNPGLVQNTLFFEYHRSEDWSVRDRVSLTRLLIVLQLRFQANRLRPFMPMWFVRFGHAVSKSMVGHR